eukprot:759222-Hanusia_phi.AAC.5
MSYYPTLSLSFAMAPVSQRFMSSSHAVAGGGTRVAREIAVALTLGLGAAFAVRSRLQQDVEPWAARNKNFGK